MTSLTPKFYRIAPATGFDQQTPSMIQIGTWTCRCRQIQNYANQRTGNPWPWLLTLCSDVESTVFLSIHLICSHSQRDDWCSLLSNFWLGYTCSIVNSSSIVACVAVYVRCVSTSIHAAWLSHGIAVSISQSSYLMRPGIDQIHPAHLLTFQSRLGLAFKVFGEMWFTDCSCVPPRLGVTSVNCPIFFILLFFVSVSWTKLTRIPPITAGGIQWWCKFKHYICAWTALYMCLFGTNSIFCNWVYMPYIWSGFCGYSLQ